ncbi:WD repeat-containing protein 18 [Thoreauomyces humboldtii]|nr:WD repeat-containing protein 18 [Thoreauomyces humboldtii]
MLAEIAVTASSVDSVVHIWDLRSGAVLGSLKGNKSNPRASSVLPLPSHAGGSLFSSSFISAQNDRALVHVWNWAKGQMLTKFGVPEKLTALAASNSGVYCVGGGESGRVYVWQLNTGKLLKVFDAHYKAVRVIRFTSDDVAFVTGGEDSVANVWRMAGVTDPSDENVVTSHKSLSGHALPITDIACGVGLFNNTRIVTSSADRTCKIWEASTGELLNTLVFPKSITSIALDSTETRLYTGSADGLIYRTNLYQSSESGSVGMVQGVNSIESDSGVFTGHTQTVTSLAFSFDGSLLLSGSEDGTAIVWDTSSKQALRTFSTHKAAISDVRILLRPPHLMDATVSAQFSSPLKPWQRHSTVGTEEEEDHTWELPASSGSLDDVTHGSQSSDGFLQSVEDRVRSMRKRKDEKVTDVDATLSRLRETVTTLSEQNTALVDINNELYQATVTKVMGNVGK